MEVKKGYLLAKNDAGNVVPFFLQVRQCDIVDTDTGTTMSGELHGLNSNWYYVTHTDSSDKRIRLTRRWTISSLTYVDSDCCYATVALPYTLDVSTTVVMVNKESNDVAVYAHSIVEGCLVDDASSGSSSTLKITLYNPLNLITESDISENQLTVHVVIDGFTV